VLLHRRDGALQVPSATDGRRRVEDVAQAEHDPGAGAVERLQGRHQLTHGAVRHVVDQQHVGPVGQRSGLDDLLAHPEHVTERLGQGDR
jgi:hypothetical protein